MSKNEDLWRMMYWYLRAERHGLEEVEFPEWGVPKHLRLKIEKLNIEGGGGAVRMWYFPDYTWP